MQREGTLQVDRDHGWVLLIDVYARIQHLGAIHESPSFHSFCYDGLPLLRILDDGNEELQRVPVRSIGVGVVAAFMARRELPGPAAIVLDAKLALCNAREDSIVAMA